MVGKSKRVWKYVLIAVLATLSIWVWTRDSRRTASRSTPPVAYEVLQDTMGSTMSIAVDSTITENQLLATLARAADDHQYDPPRDLLLTDYFTVEAYLVESGKQSAERAGAITRYVPPKNPSKQKHWTDWFPDFYGKDDKFSVSLSTAKRSLP